MTQKVPEQIPELLVCRLTGEAPVRIKTKEWVEVVFTDKSPMIGVVLSRGSGEKQEFLVLVRKEGSQVTYAGKRIWDERQLIETIEEVCAEAGGPVLAKALIGSLPAEDI